MNIGIIGIGYVGLPTAVGLASFGHSIICIDNNKEKINNLNNGMIPIYESGLNDLFNIYKKNIIFSTSYEDLRNCDFIIITVGTPQSTHGKAELKYLYEVANNIKLKEGQVIAIKSTVPVGTNKEIYEILNKSGIPFELLSMPEFLREGFAIDDFFNPDRIVIGTNNKAKIKPIIEKIYPKQYHDRLLFTDIESAELIKYASNAFLATKIHYINEIANLCEKTGANIKEVAIGMGLDTRIGTKFLCAGAGYGGSCFPKDTEALNYIAKSHNVDLDIVNAVIKGNKKRKMDLAYRIIKKVKNIENPIIAIMGIAFKSGTDDCRESSALDIIKYIQMSLNTAKIRCYDKLAIKNAKNCLENAEFYENIENTIKNANIIVIMNEDEEFKSINVDNVPIFDYRGIMPNRQNIFKIGVNNFNA